MKNIYFLLCFLFIASTSYSQETIYRGLKSKGDIPDEFTNLTSNKIDKAKSDDKKGLENVNRKAQNKFYEMTNFGIDQLLQSGRVCFNDTISNYVEEVLQEVRKSNPSIPSDIRIYTIKTPVVNAFTTDQGIIFINTGLLAQLENEAQLAFIICHELIHYMDKHVRERYVEDVQIIREKNEYRNIRNIDKDLASSKFSRSLETEADQKGLELFLNTEYNPKEIDGVFDVLLYSYLPFDEIPFDKTFMEIGEYQIPNDYFLNEVSDIEVDEDEDDSEHTHPNINKRRDEIDKMLADVSTTGSNFLISEETFLAVRSAARYEVLRLQLMDGNYSEALYSAFILENDYPNSPLPKLAIGEILYGTSLFANTSDRPNLIDRHEDQQGNVQQAYYFLTSIESRQLTLLATRYNYYLHELYPEDKTIEKRLELLFRDLVYYHDLELEEITFEKAVIDSSLLNDPVADRSTENETSSKYDRIKSKKAKKENSEEFNDDWDLGDLFVDCNCEEEISRLYENGKEKSDDKKYFLGESDDDELNAKSLNDQREYEKYKRKKGRSLGIDKIVMVDPFYAVIKQTSKKNPYKISKSNEEEFEQLDEFKYIAAAADLDIEILTNYNFSNKDVDKFNDFSIMTEWFSERMLMEGRSGIVSSSEEVSELVEKYGSKYFAWTGVVNITAPRRNKLGVFILSFYSVIGIPYGIYYLATPQKESYIYFALFNIETGDLVMYENREIPIKDSNGLLQSQYYDMFNQIKK